MKEIIEAVIAGLKQGSVAANPELQLTVLGKFGNGNVRVKVHYKRDNVVTSMLYRSDLYKCELEGNVEAVDQYVAVLKVGQNPWTELPAKGLIDLTTIPAIVQRHVDMTLPESMAVSNDVLGVLQSHSRVACFIRQWRANNGGTGVEIIFIHRDEEGNRHVMEGVVNYYQHVDTDALRKKLEADKGVVS